MKEIFRQFLREENGTVLIAVSVFMVCAVMLGALAVDCGLAYVKAAEIQTAADAAVLAAGRLLPVSESDSTGRQKILDIAAEYLGKNGVSNPDDFEIYLGEPSGEKIRCVGVRVNGAVPTSFAGIFGVDELRCTKVAEVQTMVCVRSNDVVPLSVEKSKLEECLASGIREHIVLKYGAKNVGEEEELPSGAFGAIDLDGVNGGGANDFQSWLSFGYSGEISVGDDLYPVEEGNMAGPTTAGFNARYSQCTHFPDDGGCTAEHYEPHCPRVIKVPVVVYVPGKNAQIVGFAAFVLEGQADSSKDTITGSYVDMVTIGSSGGDSTGTADDYGVYSLMLSK